ncbi:MAG: hypothetical protein KGM99_13435 [Burkholderiales bacterium]|nr:hypothetical protein [Burkholderiales bacterium]
MKKEKISQKSLHASLMSPAWSAWCDFRALLELASGNAKTGSTTTGLYWFAVQSGKRNNDSFRQQACR